MLRQIMLVALGVCLGISGAQAQAPPKQAAPAQPAKTQGSVKPPAQAVTWKTYHNQQYGFSFEYPAIYDQARYRERYGISLSDQPEDSDFGRTKFSLTMCYRVYLDIYDARGLSLEAFFNRALKKGDISNIESKTVTSVNGVKGYQVDYRFGGMNRFGTITFLKKKNHIFVFHTEAWGGNDSDPVSEWDAYAKMIDTFKFSGGK
jgi:hypothetical protein